MLYGTVLDRTGKLDNNEENDNLETQTWQGSKNVSVTQSDSGVPGQRIWSCGMNFTYKVILTV